MTHIPFILAVAMGLGAVASVCRFAAAVHEASDHDCVEYRLDNVGRAFWHLGMIILTLCAFVVLVRG